MRKLLIDQDGLVLYEYGKGCIDVELSNIIGKNTITDSDMEEFLGDIPMLESWWDNLFIIELNDNEKYNMDDLEKYTNLSVVCPDVKSVMFGIQSMYEFGGKQWDGKLTHFMLEMVRYLTEELKIDPWTMSKDELDKAVEDNCGKVSKQYYIYTPKEEVKLDLI